MLYLQCKVAQVHYGYPPLSRMPRFDQEKQRVSGAALSFSFRGPPFRWWSLLVLLACSQRWDLLNGDDATLPTSTSTGSPCPCGLLVLTVILQELLLVTFAVTLRRRWCCRVGVVTEGTKD